jgi:hypothetical protein
MSNILTLIVETSNQYTFDTRDFKYHFKEMLPEGKLLSVNNKFKDTYSDYSWVKSHIEDKKFLYTLGSYIRENKITVLNLVCARGDMYSSSILEYLKMSIPKLHVSVFCLYSSNPIDRKPNDAYFSLLSLAMHVTLADLIYMLDISVSSTTSLYAYTKDFKLSDECIEHALVSCLYHLSQIKCTDFISKNLSYKRSKFVTLAYSTGVTSQLVSVAGSDPVDKCNIINLENHEPVYGLGDGVKTLESVETAKCQTAAIQLQKSALTAELESSRTVLSTKKLEVFTASVGQSCQYLEEANMYSTVLFSKEVQDFLTSFKTGLVGKKVSLQELVDILNSKDSSSLKWDIRSLISILTSIEEILVKIQDNIKYQKTLSSAQVLKLKSFELKVNEFRSTLNPKVFTELVTLYSALPSTNPEELESLQMELEAKEMELSQLEISLKEQTELEAYTKAEVEELKSAVLVPTYSVTSLFIGKSPFELEYKHVLCSASLNEHFTTLFKDFKAMFKRSAWLSTSFDNVEKAKRQLQAAYDHLKMVSTLKW